MIVGKRSYNEQVNSQNACMHDYLQSHGTFNLGVLPLPAAAETNSPRQTMRYQNISSPG